MRTVDIIAAKRDGTELDGRDIAAIVGGYASGEVPDYQMSAFLMAVFFSGMTDAEILALTRAMAESGDILDLSDILGIKADKHSTGGVGDKTTIVVVPVLASLGLVLPKMSGRGLGFTGGTLDKLESIPGYRTDLSPQQIKEQLKQIGAVMCGQSEKMVVADRKMYALRDVTGTVDSIPLIASSIMSKKIASGADVILLDVKYGSGAFMPTKESARELARVMIKIGSGYGKKTSAILSSMNRPLGSAVGNALEIKEAIRALRSEGEESFIGLCALLSGTILHQAGLSNSISDAIESARKAMSDGGALSKLAQIIRAQGGDPRVCDDPDTLENAPVVKDFRAKRQGYISRIDSRAVGIAASHSGAGRQTIRDTIIHSAGILLNAKVGDSVSCGQTLAQVYTQDAERARRALDILETAIEISDSPVQADPEGEHEVVKK